MDEATANPAAVAQQSAAQAQELAASGQAQGTAVANSDANMQSLITENEGLKAENKKLNYRVLHLLRALDEADKKLETAASK